MVKIFDVYTPTGIESYSSDGSKGREFREAIIEDKTLYLELGFGKYVEYVNLPWKESFEKE